MIVKGWEGWTGVGFGHTREFEVEIDDKDLEGLDEEARDQYINEVVSDHVHTNVFEWGWAET